MRSVMATLGTYMRPCFIVIFLILMGKERMRLKERRKERNSIQNKTCYVPFISLGTHMPLCIEVMKSIT